MKINGLGILDHEQGRYFVYRIVAVAFAMIAISFVLFKGSLNFVVSDGRGYYVYMPSLMIDGDLDFSNQIQNNWDVDFKPELLEDRTPLGFVRNKYPLGLALSVFPSFTVAHGFSLGLHSLMDSNSFLPNGYSALYQLSTLFTVLTFGYLMMVMIDRIMMTYFALRGAAIGCAVLSFWTLSHYAYYYFREPIMVHVTSAFWVTSCLYFGLRTLSRTSALNSSSTVEARNLQYNSRRILVNLGLMFMSFAFAIVCRPTNVFIGFFVATATLISLSQAERPSLWLKTFGIGLISTFPIIIQVTVWKVMTGSWISYSYNSEGFVHAARPFLFSTLFSSLHGLFFWAPVLFLSLAGLILRFRAAQPLRDPLLAPLMLGALVLWYFNSSWHQWWFGDAFGARSFLELAPLFVFGLGFFFSAVLQQQKHSQRVLVTGAVGACGLYTYGLMALYIARKIPRAGYLF